MLVEDRQLLGRARVVKFRRCVRLAKDVRNGHLAPRRLRLRLGEPRSECVGVEPGARYGEERLRDGIGVVQVDAPITQHVAGFDCRLEFPQSILERNPLIAQPAPLRFPVVNLDFVGRSSFALGSLPLFVNASAQVPTPAVNLLQFCQPGAPLRQQV